MDQVFEQLQSEYIEALGPVVANARRWWDTHCPISHSEVCRYEAMSPFHRRWATGPAGHPRVIAVFREYYFRIRELNAQIANEAPPDLHYHRPMDFLINDLAAIAPELFEVMQGLCYVPIGKNPIDNEEC